MDVMFADLAQRDGKYLQINITPKHLLAKDFCETLRRIAAGERLARGQVVLEITERDQLPDLTEASRVVGELHDLGFRVAMDDVGVAHNDIPDEGALARTRSRSTSSSSTR
jgi:EAL domain-containing protein (putative c-di-GMP-specific phosphodiesterase class I)